MRLLFIVARAAVYAGLAAILAAVVLHDMMIAIMAVPLLIFGLLLCL